MSRETPTALPSGFSTGGPVQVTGGPVQASELLVHPTDHPVDEHPLTRGQIVGRCLVAGALWGELALVIAVVFGGLGLALADGAPVDMIATALFFVPLTGALLAMPFGAGVGVLCSALLVGALRNKPAAALRQRVWPGATLAVTIISAVLLNPIALLLGHVFSFGLAVLLSVVAFVTIARHKTADIVAVGRRHLCQDCGYDLRGSRGSACCPECGRAFAWTDELERAAREVPGPSDGA